MTLVARAAGPGLPAFSWYKIPKRGKIYQITTNYVYQVSIKYNKKPHNGPSVHKINKHLPLQDPPIFPQIWIFGLKTNHLATLCWAANPGSFFYS
jgi:hypothetical protein